MRTLILAAMLAVLASPALAHHSGVQFDFNKTVQVTGVVKAFDPVNPHMRLVLEVTDAKGTRAVEFEGYSLNTMFRAGYRPGMVKVGDTMTAEVAPLRNGAEGGYVAAAVMASGAKFGQCLTRTRPAVCVKSADAAPRPVR